MTTYDILIAGAGHAAAQCAILLRQHGFEGSIGLAGAEPEPPYERPPLSKDYLAGDKPFERMLIRPVRFWGEREIVLLPGTSIVKVDPKARIATAQDGRALGYGRLVWAAGGAPRRLACDGGDLQRVHVLRSHAEVDAIRAELDGTQRVAVIGGGYIGLEAAAVLTKLGKKVVLLEAADRVLARMAGPEISHFYEAEHRAQGVDVRVSQSVRCIQGEAGRAAAVELGTGEMLSADMALIGIGIDPAVEPLLAAGAAGGNGVDVDQHCETSLPGIYAIGDCAAHESRFAGGRRVRIESVQNAHDQAATAVKALLGRPEPYDSVPWFWSNQYDLRLQTVGLSIGHDRRVLRGRPEDRSFSLVYLRQGRVIALDCVHATRDYVQGRKLVMEGAAPSEDRLADTSVPLKELAA